MINSILLILAWLILGFWGSVKLMTDGADEDVEGPYILIVIIGTVLGLLTFVSFYTYFFWTKYLSDIWFFKSKSTRERIIKNRLDSLGK